MKSTLHGAGTVLLAGMTALLLTACDRPPADPAGQAPEQVAQVDPGRTGGMPPVGADAQPTAAGDERIDQAVSDALTRDPGLSDQSIEVEVQSGLVTLRGSVSDASMREKALQTAGAVDGVLGVEDRIVVLQKQP